MTTTVLYWHATGPKISYAEGKLIVEDLNPDSRIAFVMSDDELMSLAREIINVVDTAPKVDTT